MAMKTATILVLGGYLLWLPLSSADQPVRRSLRTPSSAAQPHTPTTPEQRQRVIMVTRALEKSPFKVGATRDREGVLYLIDHAPDIFPAIQGRVLSEVVASGVPDWRPIYAQFIFGFVSFQIENPERADDAQAVYGAALASCLRVYRHALERDKANRLSLLDVANEHDRKGTLQEYARQLSFPL